MANEPQDYSGAFNDAINNKLPATLTAHGTWRIPGLTYTEVANDDCPEVIDSEYYAGHIATINDYYLLRRDTWRGIQSAIQYMSHIASRPWAIIGSNIGGTGLVPFCTLLGQFQVMSVEGTALGSRITLRCGWQGTTLSGGPSNPGRCEVASAWGRDDNSGLMVRSATSGCVQPGDLVTFQNSVVNDWESGRGRVEPMILKVDFSDLPADADDTEITDTWTIDVDQDCSAVVNGIYDDGNRPVLAAIYGQRGKRPGWHQVDNAYPMAGKRKVVEITAADWGVSKSFQLRDHDGDGCRIWFPIAQSQMAAGILGTFKIERDSGSGYVDITDQFASDQNGTPHFPRVVISGKYTLGEKNERTDIYLGPYSETDATDYTDGAVSFRIEYWPEYLANDDTRVWGMEDRCSNCKHDLNKWVGTGAGPSVPVDIDLARGEHWYCAAWDDVPEAKRNNFSWRCAQTSCPQFAIRVPAAPSAIHTAQITNGYGIGIDQVVTGASGSSAFQYVHVGPGSIAFHLTPSQVMTSNFETAYVRKLSYLSGAFVMVDENDPITTDEDGNESIKFVTGALFNTSADFSALDYSTNPRPDDLLGILERRIARVAKTQFCETANSTTDPMGAIRAERLGRMPGAMYRDADSTGADLAYTAHSIAWPLSEDRVMRLFNHYRYMINVDLDATGNQGDSQDVTALIYASPRTVYGVENVRMVITFRGI